MCNSCNSLERLHLTHNFRLSDRNESSAGIYQENLVHFKALKRLETNDHLLFRGEPTTYTSLAEYLPTVIEQVILCIPSRGNSFGNVTGLAAQAVQAKKDSHLRLCDFELWFDRNANIFNEDGHDEIVKEAKELCAAVGIALSVHPIDATQQDCKYL